MPRQTRAPASPPLLPGARLRRRRGAPAGPPGGRTCGHQTGSPWLCACAQSPPSTPPAGVGRDTGWWARRPRERHTRCVCTQSRGATNHISRAATRPSLATQRSRGCRCTRQSRALLAGNATRDGRLLDTVARGAAPRRARVGRDVEAYDGHRRWRQAPAVPHRGEGPGATPAPVSTSALLPLAGSEAVAYLVSHAQKLDTVRWSLTYGGQSVSTRDEDGYTAIQLAASANKPKVLQLLLDICRRSRELELIDLRDGAVRLLCLAGRQTGSLQHTSNSLLIIAPPLSRVVLFRATT